MKYIREISKSSNSSLELELSERNNHHVREMDKIFKGRKEYPGKLIDKMTFKRNGQHI